MNDVKEKYELIEKLGSGNFGTVYKVRNNILDRIEALKIVEGVSPKDYEKQLEAKVQHKLQHKNIVEIYDAYVRNNKLYISMEYLNGGTLESRAKSEHVTVKEVVRYLIDCLYGLQHIHNNGYIHRDLKPNNILMNNNTIKLSDFGLADLMDEDKELKSDFGYTFHRAPEVFTRKAYCEQSDIYALGVTAFRLLNGDNHIKGNQNLKESILNGTFPPRDKFHYRKDVPKKLVDIINKALDVNLTNRYSSAHHFRHALKAVTIPIDWVLITNRDNKQVWLGGNGVSKYKLEVTRKILSEKYNIEVYKGNSSFRKITKYCSSDIPVKKIDTQVRKLLTMDL